jgi:mycofactocin system FadH/OYE family oxidoreductase 2
MGTPSPPGPEAAAGLLQPLDLGRRRARNRIVFGPHVTNLARDGLPGERLIAYLERRARGGAGVVVVEEAQVHPSSHPYQRCLRGDRAEMETAYRELAERLHWAGALAVAALGHAGMQGTGQIRKRPLWAPSAIANPATLEMPKVMEAEDLEEVVRGFAAAASRAVAAGMDGVEVNAGQYSLIRQFLSALTNQRQDGYGGEPERRLRFARRVLEAVRAAVGEERLVGLRLCCDERAPWAGIRPEEAPDLAAALCQGVDYLVVTAGSIYSPEVTWAGLQEEPGYLLQVAGAVRRRLATVPVVATGSLEDPEVASRALAEGHADACEMTRALIADPDLPLKLERGEVHRVRPCIRCNQDCCVRSAANAAVSCIHNPEAGHETESSPPPPVRRPARVLVVGGGPAGMEAARVAAERGHRVTLLERAPALGGVPRAVAQAGQRPPFGLVSAWLADRLGELGVELRLGVEADAASVLEEEAEAVVLATGGTYRPPTVPGGDLGHVVGVREVLGGSLPGSGPVVVVDGTGSYPAIDAACVAAGRGRAVTVLTQDALCAAQLAPTGELAPWYRAAAALGIELRPMTVVVAIEPGCLRVRHRFSAREEELAADCVVWADHELPDDRLYRELRALAPNLALWRAGDCLAPRRVLQAVLEGGRVAREV